MLALPAAIRPLLDRFSLAFTARTFQRVQVLIVGAILCTGPRTVTAMLRAARSLVKGHFSSYHRVLSRSRFRAWPLAKVLCAMVLELIPPDQPLLVGTDDTTAQHKGKHVYGKGRHHDACRSTHSHVVWVWGHKWVVLCLLVRFPFCSRRWALPVLVALYRSPETDRSEGRRHKTCIQLARQMMAALIHWFPQRKFMLLGDGGYASHHLAAWCRRHRRHVTLISRLHPHSRSFPT